MLTARRLREARDREMQGQAVPVTNPERISWTDHEKAIGDLNMAHARAMSALRAELEGAAKGGGGKGSKRVKELEAALEVETAKVADLEKQVAKLSSDLDTANALLADVDSHPPQAPPEKGNKPKG